MATWVLVAHASGARLFRSVDGVLTEFRTIEHPEGRRPEDWTADREGRAALGGSARTAYEPHTDLTEADTDRFAHQLSDELTPAAGREEFKELVVVAPHKLLGRLKDVVPKNVGQRVSRWVAKDFAHADAFAIERALAEA